MRTRSMRALLLVVALACPAAAGSAAAAPAYAPPVQERHLDDERDCTQIPPERVPSPLAADPGVLPLEVRVLVEARDLPKARSSFAVTRGVFQRIGIDLRVSYDVVRRLPDTTPTGDMRETLFAFARSRYGGQRPAGTDAVYVMTRAWAGGFADCIGGIADPRRAFALGSVDYTVEGLVPVPTVDEGHIAAHELGHLLGAHHHYANCAEAQPAAALRGEPGTCTVMSPGAATLTGSVATLERAYVRSYAREFARG